MDIRTVREKNSYWKKTTNKFDNQKSKYVIKTCTKRQKRHEKLVEVHKEKCKKETLKKEAK
jgi:hypothetical protein